MLFVCVFYVYVSSLRVSIHYYGRKIGKSVKILLDVHAICGQECLVEATCTMDMCMMVWHGMVWCVVMLCNNSKSQNSSNSIETFNRNSSK